MTPRSRTAGLRSVVAVSLLATALAVALVAAPVVAPPSARGDGEPRLTLERGDRIAIVGGSFVEGMALYGWFETLLHCAYPRHQLVVRHLGWSGDEVDLQPRPANFGTLEEHLDWLDVDVVLLCYGMNESFAGAAGLQQWRERLDAFLAKFAGRSFGDAPVRLVLVSPIAHEDLGDPLPTGAMIERRHAELTAYRDVMRDAARTHGIPFVDLLARHLDWIDRNQPALTRNGIHPHERGQQRIAGWMAEELAIPLEGGARDGGFVEVSAVREQVHAKNRLFFLMWRPLNSFYIWGGRAYCWRADDPMAELERIGAMIDAREAALHRMPFPPPARVLTAEIGTREIWETPIDHELSDALRETTPPERPIVRRNGALK